MSKIRLENATVKQRENGRTQLLQDLREVHRELRDVEINSGLRSGVLAVSSVSPFEALGQKRYGIPNTRSGYNGRITARKNQLKQRLRELEAEVEALETPSPGLPIWEGKIVDLIIAENDDKLRVSDVAKKILSKWRIPKASGGFHDQNSLRKYIFDVRDRPTKKRMNNDSE